MTFLNNRLILQQFILFVLCSESETISSFLTPEDGAYPFDVVKEEESGKLRCGNVGIPEKWFPICQGSIRHSLLEETNNKLSSSETTDITRFESRKALATRLKQVAEDIMKKMLRFENAILI